MQGMLTPEFGGLELFEERDVERPEPGPGEILGHGAAGDTNPVNAKLRADGSFAGLEPPVIHWGGRFGRYREVSCSCANDHTSLAK